MDTPAMAKTWQNDCNFPPSMVQYCKKGGVRVRRLLLAVLCLLLLALPVRGAEAGNTMEVTAVVDGDGSCRMAVKLTLHLNGAERLVLPVGHGARDATVNGTAAKVQQLDNIQALVLESPAGFQGVQTCTLTYTLPSCIQEEESRILRLPLVPEGLAYPIDRLSFRVTLPGNFSEMPVFTSGYYGEDVDNYMTISVSGPEITGSINTVLRDQDSLILTMEASPALFPRSYEAGKLYAIACLATFGFGLLGLLYWLLRLRWRPVRAAVQAQAPVGVGPGEVGCRLLARSPDLPLMVVSWAQLGYLTIHVGQDWAVTLHKRMDMGNERSAYERGLFQALFGREQLADGGGERFQALQKRTAAASPRVQGQFQQTGRPFWVRLLGCLMGLCAGVAAGDLGAPGVSWRIALVVLWGLSWAAAAWLLQDGFRSLLSWERRPGLLSLGACVFLLVTGLLAGCLGLSLVCCLTQCLLGLLVLFGGRRSEAGRQTISALLGLRRYLRTVDRKQLHRVLQQNPGYYYDMAPYALALGADRQFARRFDRMRLPACPWLVTDFPTENSAQEWYPLLRQVIRALRGRFPAPTRQKQPAGRR